MSVPVCDPLGSTVRGLFSSLQHAGEPADGPALAGAGSDAARMLQGEAGRERRGTRVRFTLRVVGDTLTQVRYRAYGCPHTLAACEWLARQLESRRLEAIGDQPLPPPIGGPADWARQLQIPPAKLGRLLVVEDALRAALAQADEAMTKAL